MKHEAKMEMVSELADAVLRWGNPTMNVEAEEENGDTKYNEEAQEMFNYLYDRIETIVDQFMEKKELVSNCCSAKGINGICQDCKEPATEVGVE